MSTLWKRATPSQFRVLRIVAGAVRNTAHAHDMDISSSFARSVAKRAAGTLTAQWPDVLAAKTPRRQNGSGDIFWTPKPRGSQTGEGHSKGDRLTSKRRSPLRAAWKHYSSQMIFIKKNGTPEQFEAHVRVLKLLDEAQKILESIQCQETTTR